MTTAKKARRTKAKTNGAAKTATTIADTKLFSRVQHSFRDAGDALREVGGLAGNQSRKIALKVIANAEENMTQGGQTALKPFGKFVANLRETPKAERKAA